MTAIGPAEAGPCRGFDGDPVIGALRELPAYDVGSARAQRLRERCHKHLAIRDQPVQTPAAVDAATWRPLRVVAGVWCVLYVLAAISMVAGVYGR